MAIFNILLALLGFLPAAFAAFGLTENSDSFIVDAGSSNPLIATIRKSDCDIRSILYYGNQLQNPDSQGTHIGSGLGSATVTAQTISSTYRPTYLPPPFPCDGCDANNLIDKYIKITCETSTLTHYIVVVSGQSNLYMATYITAEPSIGELRYIARLDSSKLPDEYPFGDVSTTKPSTSTVEGSDVFVVNGQTRSKFYSSQRFIDDDVHCVGSGSLHACFVKPQYESSSGGPFFRDINSNNGGVYTSLTFYMNSGHVQTEKYRMGLHGPYALTFTRSGIPRLRDFDFSFFADLNIKGYVPTSGRGYVSGTATGTASGLDRIVHWYNDAAQYWADGTSGRFTSPAMKPGTYTMKLYQNELEVASQSVQVSAGSTTTSNIASALKEPSSRIWTIGVCDGQPTGFRNADKQLRMHPSDSRMSSWGPLTYTVGSSSLTDMPMAIFQSVNSPQTISFTLSSSQLGAATLRIRTTLAFASGRPSVVVNSWSGRVPAAPTRIDSRGVTRGAYRGYGEAYEFAIPAGTLVSGKNTITISVASGSSGATFLSPNFVSFLFSSFSLKKGTLSLLMLRIMLILILTDSGLH